MKVKLITEGGKMTPGPAIAQQLGPLGINLGKVISDVNTATKGFAGIKVPVEIDVNTKTKTFTIQVFSPPVAELIKKELSLEAGSGKPNTIKVGNIALETLLGIAKTKSPDLLAKDLKAALKLVLGTCVSLGVIVDNKDPRELQKEIDAGTHKEMIAKEITQPSEQKKKELDSFFKDLKAQQDRAIKAAEEAAKAAEEAAAAAAAAAGATPGAPAAAGATPADAKGAAAPAADAKAAPAATKAADAKPEKKK